MSSLTYQQIQPYLRAFKVIIRDKQFRTLTEQEAKRRSVVRIESGKVRPDELYIIVA